MDIEDFRKTIGTLDDTALYALLGDINNEIERRRADETADIIIETLVALDADGMLSATFGRPVELTFGTVEYDDGYAFSGQRVMARYRDGIRQPLEGFDDSPAVREYLTDMTYAASLRNGHVDYLSELRVSVPSGRVEF